MEFATPQVVIDAIKERLDRRIFGYTRIFSDAYYKLSPIGVLKVQLEF